VTGSEDPKPSSYRPFVSARRPGGPPAGKPKWRVIVHRKHLQLWNDLVDRCGLQAAQQCWDHLAFNADRPSPFGNITMMKGKLRHGKDGWSGVHHYEITGAGRVDFHTTPTSLGAPSVMNMRSSGLSRSTSAVTDILPTVERPHLRIG
jgi:hypothetical protein